MTQHTGRRDMKPQPIREGDYFRDSQGRVWRVEIVYPGGKIWIYNEARKRAGMAQHALVRQWERLPKESSPSPSL